MKPTTLHKVIFGVFWATWASNMVTAQSDSGTYRMQVYSLDSGIHDGDTARSSVPFRHVVRAPDATWLRLRIGDYNLGDGSYITFTSLEDGGRQRLDARTLPQWGNSTAFFNGDAVEVELHVAPGDRGVYLRIEQIAAGQEAEDAGTSRAICGSDDRTPSYDGAVGRLVFFPTDSAFRKCTAWIASNGAQLTAGHCAPRNFLIAGTPTPVMPAILEFNVPVSSSTGIPTASALNDQYPIIQASINASANPQLGDDWAVFACNPNANTLLLPVQAQGAFIRMARPHDLSPDTSSNSAIKITGYGTGTVIPELRQVQQTAWGPYMGEIYNDWSDAYVEFAVDAMPGNSGGPVRGGVVSANTTLGSHAIGIVSDEPTGGCDSTTGNYGTSFENNDLEDAIQTFPGPNVLYVDNGHNRSWVQQNGTIFRPFFGVNGAVNGAPAGALISIVKGSYPDPFSTGWRGETMTLEAPVGSVVIGD